MVKWADIEWRKRQVVKWADIDWREETGCEMGIDWRKETERGGERERQRKWERQGGRGEGEWGVGGWRGRDSRSGPSPCRG